MNRAYIYLPFLLLLLAGCSTPQTFRERLIVGYETVAEVRTGTATLLNAKKISSADGENVQQQADLARQGLDIAKGLEKQDLPAAELKLTATQTVIRALKDYLIARQGATK